MWILPHTSYMRPVRIVLDRPKKKKTRTYSLKGQLIKIIRVGLSRYLMIRFDSDLK